MCNTGARDLFQSATRVAPSSAQPSPILLLLLIKLHAKSADRDPELL
jgi:hypothetical protein